MPSLAEALRTVAAALSDAGMPYAVVGGIANIARGEQRATTDVDFSVDIHETGARRLVEVASALGKVPADPVAYVERNRFLPLITHQGVRIDLLVATLSFEIDALTRATIVNVDGIDVPVCSAEDLIVFKLVANRPRDWIDIEGILRRQADRLDIDRIEGYVREIAVDFPEIAERFEEVKSEAGLAD